MAKPNPLRTFEQLGVIFTNQSGKDDQGDCPFCGKVRAFHVNPLTTQWTCSSSPARCGESGNLTSFLTKWHEHCLQETTRTDYTALALARGGVPVEAWEWAQVALNPLTDEWLIPSRNSKGKVQDLRRWKPGQKGLQGVANCPNNLWGASGLTDPDRRGWPVDICEGEWDGISWAWLMRQIRRRVVVVAVPGTRTFKEEWWPLFAGRDVRWLYDNDDDGHEYSFRNSKKLQGIARTQQFLKWPDDTPDKYDIRDFICEWGLKPGTAKKTYKKLNKLIVKSHWLKDKEEEEAAQAKVIVRPRTNSTLRETIEVYRKELVMSPDMEDALKVVYATVLSNQLPDDPIWLYLVGAASGGKTELLMSLSKVPDVSYHSSVNAKSMMSGFKTPGQEDPSLIPQLIGKTAVFKDWTEVLASHPHDKTQLDAVLRGAYDGHIRRQWGNGKRAEHHGTFNILAGVTPVINSHNDSMMGERFLKFQLQHLSARKEERLIKRVLAAKSDPTRNERLQHAADRFLNREISGPFPEFTKSTMRKVNALARFVAMLRAKPPWEREGSDKFLQYEAAPEVGVRLAKQFRKLGTALAIVEGRRTVDDRVYRLLHRIGMDTATGWPQKMLATMLETGPASVAVLSQACRMNEQHVRRVMTDMLAMNCVISRSGTRSSSPSTNGRLGAVFHITNSLKKLCEEIQFNADAGQEAWPVSAAGS